MDNFKSLDEYLIGKKFDNGLRIQWDFDDKKLTSRIQYLSQICQNNHVIHLGCLDHNFDTITRKIANNTWLHKQLTDVSAYCLGIDIDSALINRIKEIGINNVVCSDLSIDDIRPEITPRQWDYLICGEVIEHINNPTMFLSAIRQKYAPFIKHIVVTVPNSLSLGHIKNAFKTVESISTDHRYSFTPYNISKILVMSGYHLKRINMTLHFDPKTRGPFHRMIFKQFPLLRSDIIVEASF